LPADTGEDLPLTAKAPAAARHDDVREVRARLAQVRDAERDRSAADASLGTARQQMSAAESACELAAGQLTAARSELAEQLSAWAGRWTGSSEYATITAAEVAQLSQGLDDIGEPDAASLPELFTMLTAARGHALTAQGERLRAREIMGSSAQYLGENAHDHGEVRAAVRVLEYLAGRPAGFPIALPALAAHITGDTKALNHGTTLATLVLRALALREGLPRPGSAAERRDLWDSAGVVTDDLASRVLVLNLPASGAGLGEWLAGAARYGTPFQVTLHQLDTHPIQLAATRIFACENPATGWRGSR
jgi:hypothetical protein